MDLVLDAANPLFLDAMYSKLSPEWMGVDRSDITRQFFSLYLVGLVGGHSPTPISPRRPSIRSWLSADEPASPSGRHAAVPDLLRPELVPPSAPPREILETLLPFSASTSNGGSRINQGTRRDGLHPR